MDLVLILLDYALIIQIFVHNQIDNFFKNILFEKKLNVVLKDCLLNKYFQLQQLVMNFDLLALFMI